MTGLTMNRLLEQKLNDLNRDLKKYFERKVQLSQKRKSEALSYWEPIVDCIINYVKRITMIDLLPYVDLALEAIMKERKLGSPMNLI